MFNPRFEEEFAAGKDYDPDRRDLRDQGSGLWPRPPESGFRALESGFRALGSRLQPAASNG